MELFLTLRLCNIFDLSTSTADAVINIRANDLDDLEHVTRETMATDNSSGEIYDVECVDDSHLQQVSIWFDDDVSVCVIYSSTYVKFYVYFS